MAQRWDKNGNPIAEAPKRWDKDGNPIMTPRRAVAPIAATPTPEPETPGMRAALESYSQQRDMQEQASPFASQPAESFYRGVTLGHTDDLRAKVGRVVDEALNLGSKVIGKERQWTPEEYEKAIYKYERGKEEKYKKERPALNAAGEIGGSLLLPFGSVDKGLEAIGIASPAVRAALQGSVTGGFAGHGAANTDDQRKLNDATTMGTLSGGAIGGLATPAMSLAQHGLAPLWNAGKGAVERLMIAAEMPPGAPLTPRAMEKGIEQGNEYVRQLVQRIDPTRAKLAAPAGLEPIKLKAGEIPARPITGAEALGREGVTQLKVLGRRGGKTPDKLEAQLAARAAETPGQVADDFATAFGVSSSDIAGDFAGAMANLRQNATPLYEDAFSVGPINSDLLEAIANTPAGREAMARAYKIAGNEMRNPRELGFGVAPARGGGDPNAPAEIVLVGTPTMRTWDYVKRGLDSVISGYRDKTTGRLKFSDPEAHGVVNLSEKLRDELIKLNPKYEAALKAGGEPIRMEKAFTSASKLMQGGTSMKRFEDEVSKYSLSEQKAFIAGLVNDVVEKAASGRQRLNAIVTPQYEAKLVRFLGVDDARALMRSIEERKGLLDTGRRMKPGNGSDTSETLIGRDEQDVSVSIAQNILNHIRHGRFGSAASSLIAEPLAGAMRGVQAPIDRAARDRAGQLLAMDPKQLLKELEAYEGTIPQWLKIARRARDEENIRARMAASAAAGAAQGDNITPERR